MKTIKQKALSPIVATIFLVVVSVIMITLVLNWGKGFTNTNLDKPNNILKETTQNYMIGSPKLNAQGVLTFKNITPGDKSITITGYRIISSSEDGNFNSTIDLNETTILPGATHVISIPAFPPEQEVTILLITDENEYISVGQIQNIPEDLQDIPEPPSSENLIIYFTILDVSGTIDSDLNTISLELPYGTNVTSLTPTIIISEDATVNPLSGSSQNFTSPVEYTVTAEDESTRIYTVTITILEIQVPEGVGETPTNGEIWYLEHLAYIDTNADTRAANYTLMRDLDFDSDDSYYNASANKTTWTTGTGWDPIGANETLFTGDFDGNNYKISNLYINRPTMPDYDGVGLFGDTNATITNISLIDVNITGEGYVGAFIGFGYGYLLNCHSSGVVAGTSSIAGLVGRFTSGDLNFCSSSCLISASTGIAGGLGGDLTLVNINNSYATGDVSGTNYVGGLVGSSFMAVNINNSYATGDVSGTDYVGGLVGTSEMYAGNITNCYSLGNVTRSSGSKTTYFGGFIGYSSGSPGICTNNYSTGSVSGSGWTPTNKGFSGTNLSASSSGNFWDMNTSLQTTSATGATGRTTADMKQQATFTGWDFTNIWAIQEGTSYPYLRDNTQSPLPQ